MNPFFSSDDWFHLRLSDIHSFREFLNFFSFFFNPQTASFYRPLSTQVFFLSFQRIFGLNPLPYYVFGFILFCLSIYLLYKFTSTLTKNVSLVIFFYAISVTNFTRLFFISAYQELFLVNFVLLSLITFRKKPVIAIASFILALLSKETAVVLPPLLLLIDWYQNKINLKRLIPYIAILIPYLYLRLFVFHGSGGDSYIWDFSPIRAANTLFWYSLWSLGAPELLVDYVGSGLKILPRFFTDYPLWSKFILTFLAATIINTGLLLIKFIRKIDRTIIFSAAFFTISLFPVLFLPWHKFTLELTLPMIGFAYFLSHICEHNKNILSKSFIFLFLILNTSMFYLTYTRSYAVNRGLISRNLINFLQSNYPTPPKGYFEFINDTGDYGAEWGSSKQISNASGGSELFRVFYHNQTFQVYFEDYPGDRPDTVKIPLSTKSFVSNTIETR